MKYVPDTSVIIDQIISDLAEKGELKGTVLIANAVIAELENQANIGRETGFLGLEEVQKLQSLVKKKKIELQFIGNRPSPDQIKYAKSGGEIDALIREIAYKEKATLVTADKVQAESAKAFNIKVKFVEQELPKDKIQIENYFDAHTMSIHIKADCYIYAKKGKPGKWDLLKINNKKLSKTEVQNLAKEITDKATFDPGSFVEISRRGSSVVQYKEYRIVIVKPPVADGWEITVVRPIKKLNLQDYKLSPTVLKRVTEQSCGVIVTGQVGSGKTTFCQALAESFSKQRKIIKTIESPRDLQLVDKITQYGKNFTTSEELHDILFLTRPDHIIFDEMRDTPDFKLYTDLRLAGSNVIGVLHANQAIDAVQRFIGRLETGMIPSVLDVIIFMDSGKISKILSLQMKVKVPTGMTEADLARPVVEVKDFETNKLEFEIYSYGEETVVIPVKKTANPAHELAAKELEREFRRYTDNVKVEILGETQATVYVDDQNIARIIGKGGEHIEQLENKLGIHLNIESIGQSLEKELAYTVNENKRFILFYVKSKPGKKVDVYINGRYICSAITGNKKEIKFHKKSEHGKSLINALDSEEEIQLKG